MPNQKTFARNKATRGRVVPFQHLSPHDPAGFSPVALHWQDSMELVFVKKGAASCRRA